MFGYENIGGKIKSLSVFQFFFVLVATLCAGSVILIEFGLQAWWVFFVIPGAPVFALVASWPLYGFGELIEKTSEIAQNTRALVREEQEPEAESEEQKVEYAEIEYVDVICQKCGKKLSFGKDDEEYECPFCGCRFSE